MTEEREHLRQRIQWVEDSTFEEIALAVYRYQLAHNPFYRRYVELLGRLDEHPTSLTQIPFLPITFFKDRIIQTGNWKPKLLFTSSGTTGAGAGRHAVREVNWYEHISRSIFESFYGPLSDHTILALLPSYLERSGSSLVYMVSRFIHNSRPEAGGFFLNNLSELKDRLSACRKEEGPTLLLGVSFALLDLAEHYPIDLSGITVMETGGMKGRRRELTRPELHRRLKEAFNVKTLHSEYGMTELFSQAYSKEKGLFFPGATMRVLSREITDPLSSEKFGRTGALNIIDLANVDTCSFVATDDLGRCYPDGSFEVLGRMDGSDIRGCNLMMADFA